MVRYPLSHARRLCFVIAPLALLMLPAFAWSTTVHPRFDLTIPQTGPFPSDRFTAPDAAQNTGLRIALPKPDCALRPSDCGDIDVLNELDGFNLLPRLSIPFDGPIDVETVTSGDVFLVNLGNTLPGGDPAGHMVGIDQIVWDPDRNTLNVESDELLDQHARYVLVVTKDVRDRGGKEVKAAKEFLEFKDPSVTTSTGDPALDAYRSSVRDALAALDALGDVPSGQVVAASVFTTMSVSANLEKVRNAIDAATPDPANFLLGAGGARTVYPRSSIATIVFRRQMNANPASPLSNANIALGPIDVVPGAVGRVAFGRYHSPEYRVHPGEFIPAVGTRTGTPAAQGMTDITFVLFLPSSPPPAGGYPVAIFGHGANSDKMTSTFVAAKLAESGIATIAIDAPGTGFGPVSAYALTFTDATTGTFLSGGRGLDQNGDGRIAVGEGGDPVLPRAMLGTGGTGDGHRQRAIDHMQLVRVIQAGMDVDGDASPDLDASRIYYVGTSGGGRQGAILLAVDPDVRAGVLNAPNSSAEERLTSARDVLGTPLQNRTPSLVNAPGVASIDGIAVAAPRFDENLPLRQGAPYSVVLQDGSMRTVRSPIVNGVAGAIEIQEAIERAEWAFQQANTAAYASFLRRHPLAGVPPKPVIVQFAWGDRIIPNPATSSMIRAGDLADRTTLFRTDLAFAVNPVPIPAAPNVYPHLFLQIFADPALTAVALQVQGQIASFFALDGPSHVLDPYEASQIVDPDGAGPIFETPIGLPLPSRLNYPLSGSLASAQFTGEAAPLGTEGAGDPALGRVLSAHPVPYRDGRLDVVFALGRVGGATLDIYDLTGRHVRRLVAPGASMDGHHFTWDGRSERGAAVAPGVYLLRAHNGDGRAAEAKVVVVR